VLFLRRLGHNFLSVTVCHGLYAEHFLVVICFIIKLRFVSA